MECVLEFLLGCSDYVSSQFFFQSKLNALSQKDDVAYIPNIVRYKDTIKTKIVHFFNSKVKESLKELDSYIIDIFVGTNKVCWTISKNCLYSSGTYRNYLLFRSQNISCEKF